MLSKMRLEYLIVMLLLVISLLEFGVIMWGYNFVSSAHPYVLADLQASPKVIVVDIRGNIVSTMFSGTFDRPNKTTVSTSAENVKRMLEYLEGDNSVKAFILDIDSNGGETSAGNEIVRTLQRSNKTTVAVIHNQALSSGYEVASGTDRIFASPESDVGDIAAIQLDLRRLRDGSLQICQVASARYKDMILDDCPGYSEEEINDLRKYAIITHMLFVEEVAQNRNMSLEVVANLSDGSIYKGKEALENGLIDELGDLTDAVQWLEKKEGTKLKVVYLRELLGEPTWSVNDNKS